LRYRHVKHVNDFHPKEFKAFMRLTGAKYPKMKRKKVDGEQVGDQVVNHGEHMVNLGDRVGEQMVNHGEHQYMINHGEKFKLVNIGEQ
jgi:hypothetical protein